MRRAVVLWGVFVLCGPCLQAAEPPGTFEVGSYRGPTGNTYRQDFENPKEAQGNLTGTIRSIDRISGMIGVLDAKGVPMEFLVETNTSVQDHHLQIALDDLRLGDQITVHYGIDPRRVNRIERL